MAPLVAVSVDVETSTPNRREPWGLRHRRVREERAATTQSLAAHPAPAGPLRVTLTRCGRSRRALDDDNLRGALKTIRDACATWIGRDDAHPSIRWEYRQVLRCSRPGVAIVVERWSDAPPEGMRVCTGCMAIGPVDAPACSECGVVARVRRPRPSPEARAESERRRAETRAFMETLVPALPVPGEIVRDPGLFALDERTGRGDLALVLPRREGAAELVAVVRGWDGADGRPAREYVNVHVRWRVGASAQRSRGVALDVAELRPVALALLDAADRLDAAGRGAGAGPNSARSTPDDRPPTLTQ